MGAAWAMSRAPELLSIGRDIMVSEHTYQPDQLELSATPCVVGTNSIILHSWSSSELCLGP